jgi:5'-3' exonuclease
MFDCGGSLRKKAIFEEYKQNRNFQATTGSMAAFNDPNTDLFCTLKEKVIALCRIFNLPVIHEYGIEADDIIGIATEEFCKLGKQIILLSNDSDFLQLLSVGSVVCSIPYKKLDVDASGFPQFFSECSKSKGVAITASEYIFYKALVGDTSDNIDGIKGLGYKTLHKLLTEQLQNETPENRTLYMTDGLEYAKQMAKNNTTKLEKLVNTNLDTVIRNYKLIDLSSRFASTHTIQLTLKKLLEASEAPSRKDIIREFHTLFPGHAHVEFLLNTLFALKNIYQVPEE